MLYIAKRWPNKKLFLARRACRGKLRTNDKETPRSQKGTVHSSTQVGTFACQVSQGHAVDSHPLIGREAFAAADCASARPMARAGSVWWRAVNIRTTPPCGQHNSSWPSTACCCCRCRLGVTAPGSRVTVFVRRLTCSATRALPTPSLMMPCHPKLVQALPSSVHILACTCSCVAQARSVDRTDGTSSTKRRGNKSNALEAV